MIEFKSLSKYFDDEKSGLKNWTIREIPKIPDARFTVLRNWMKNKEYGNIKITRSELPNNSFIRQIKHITKFDNYYCITWRS